MEPKLCFIREAYFKKNSSYIKWLDAGDTSKQSKRTHSQKLSHFRNKKRLGQS